MASIAFPDLMLVTYVLVDDWYVAEGQFLVPPRPGPPAALSISELLTILLSMDTLPFPSEHGFLAFVRANYPDLFPRLPHQSQFNRQARAAWKLLEALRQAWATELAIPTETHLILDTKPVPVVGYKRRKTHSDFAGSASFGFCASRNMHYFGYKLVMLSTLEGLPVVYDLVPAHMEERDAAMSILHRVRDCDIWADKGFLGEDWQQDVATTTGNRVWTEKRTNQDQNPPAFDALLSHVRERIEGTFNELQNTGRNLERLLTKTIRGIMTRVATKVTHLTLKYLLRRQYRIDLITFQLDNNKLF